VWCSNILCDRLFNRDDNAAVNTLNFAQWHDPLVRETVMEISRLLGAARAPTGGGACARGGGACARGGAARASPATRVPEAWRELGTNSWRLWMALVEEPDVAVLSELLAAANLCIADSATPTPDCQMDALWASLSAHDKHFDGMESAAQMRARVAKWLDEHLRHKVAVRGHDLGELTYGDLLRIIEPKLSDEAFMKRFKLGFKHNKQYNRPQQAVWGNAVTLLAASAALNVVIRVVSATVEGPVLIDATTGGEPLEITIGHARAEYFYPVRKQGSDGAASEHEAGEQEEHEAGEQAHDDDADKDDGGGGGGGAMAVARAESGGASAAAAGGKRGRRGARGQREGGERGGTATGKRHREAPTCSKCRQQGHRSGHKSCPQYEPRRRCCSVCGQEGHTKRSDQCQAYRMTDEQRQALMQQRALARAQNKRTASATMDGAASAGRPGKRRRRQQQLTPAQRERAKALDRQCWAAVRAQMQANNWQHEVYDYNELIEQYYDFVLADDREPANDSET
jgi:hypothetical protein